MEASSDIMIVEDETIVALEIEERLKSCGYNVVASVASGEKAVEMAALLQPNLILMDIRLEGSMNGIEAAGIINRMNRFGLPIIFLTAYSDEQTLEQAADTKPYGYLLKPFKEQELHATIQMALRKFETDQILATNEENFRLAFENAPVYCYMVSLDGEILNVNSTALTALNYSREMLVGKPLRTLYGSNCSLLIEQQLTDLKNGQAVANKEMDLVTADEAKRIVIQSARLVRAVDGSELYILLLQEDITKSKETEEALYESEKRHRTLVESMKDLVFVYDKNDCYSQYYASDEQLLMVPPRDFLGKHLSDVLNHDIGDGLLRAIQTARDTGESTTFDYPLKIGDKIHWFSAIQSLHEDGSSVVSVVRDISERVQAEEELRTSEEKYSQLFRMTRDAILIRSMEGDMLDVNQSALDLFGFSRPEFLSMKLTRIADRETIRQIVEAIDRQGWTRIEAQLRKKNGEKFIADVSSNLVKIGNQTVIQTIVSDITERKHAEETLKRSEEKYRALAESSLQGIAIYQKGVFVYSNQAYADISGYTIDEILSFKPEQVWQSVYPDDAPLLNEAYSKFLEGGGLSKRQEFRLVRKDGSCRWVESFFAPIEYNGEEAIQIVMIDNTEQKEAAKNIEDARNRAEFFLDLMGHDISNIHQAIYGIFDLLLMDTTLTGSARELVEVGIDQMNRSARLISNVRKLQKIEDAPPRLTPTDPFDALSLALERARNDMPAKTLNLKTKAKAGLYEVMADEYLTDVFYAILNNAMRFDPNSQVDVELDMGMTKDRSRIRIQVSDHGTGIPDETKRMLFGRMSFMKTGYHGTGIGLTLLNRIISHYGGQVEVKDRVPADYRQGVRFIIEIPRASID